MPVLNRHFFVNLHIMTFTALSIISLILSLAAVVAMFVPRVPAVPALVCAHFDGAVYINEKILIFWGVATAIVLGLRALQPKAIVLAKGGQAYVAVATLIGTLLGYLASATAAAIIIGGAVGSFLGATAYMRTPASPRLPLASQRFVEFLSAKGLPSIVTASMVAITIASQL